VRGRGRGGVHEFGILFNHITVFWHKSFSKEISCFAANVCLTCVNVCASLGHGMKNTQSTRARGSSALRVELPNKNI
jgi:hypothetical protein